MEEMIAECTKMMESMNSMMGEGMMGGGMMNGFMMGSGMMTPWWILGWLLVIATSAAFVLALVWAVRRLGKAENKPQTKL